MIGSRRDIRLTRYTRDSLWILSCTAPPKGLDDDEFEYIKELESKKNDVEQQRQAQHKEDLADFRTHFEIL